MEALQHISRQIGVIEDKLRTGKTATDSEDRARLFTEWNTARSNFLSLAEIDEGVFQTLGLDERFTPAVNRAVDAAKALTKGKEWSGDDDHVSRAEFQALLVYMKLCCQLYVIFLAIDTSRSCRIDPDEFRAAVPSLRRWGCPFPKDDAEAFRELDLNGSGQIKFAEFAQWAIPNQVLEHVRRAADALSAESTPTKDKQRAAAATRAPQHGDAAAEEQHKRRPTRQQAHPAQKKANAAEGVQRPGPLRRAKSESKPAGKVRLPTTRRPGTGSTPGATREARQGGHGLEQPSARAAKDVGRRAAARARARAEEPEGQRSFSFHRVEEGEGRQRDAMRPDSVVRQRQDRLLRNQLEIQAHWNLPRFQRAGQLGAARMPFW